VLRCSEASGSSQCYDRLATSHSSKSWAAFICEGAAFPYPVVCVVQGLCTYTAVGVDAAGLVSADDVVAALTPNTVLVTIMHSNNEVRGCLLQGQAGLLLTTEYCACHELVAC
jgi:hypothetical protein